MVQYEAELGTEPQDIITIRVYPHRRERRPTASVGLASLHVKVRFADQQGHVHRHHGVLFVRPGRTYSVAGFQTIGTRLVVTLSGRGSDAGTAQPMAIEDEFELPFQLTAWGWTAMASAGCRVQAVCHRLADGVSVRGCLQVTLRTAVTTLQIPVVFLRRLRPVETVTMPIMWRSFARVVRLQVQVAPDGTVTGAARIALRCEGGLSFVSGAGGAAPRVKETRAVVASIQVHPTADERANVSTQIETDVYYSDTGGRGRWTGRGLSDTQPIAISGAVVSDRFEPAARIEHVRHVAQGNDVRLQITGSLEVAAYRPVLVQYGETYARVELLVGTEKLPLELTTVFTLDGDRARYISERCCEVAHKGEAAEDATVGFTGIDVAVVGEPSRGRLKVQWSCKGVGSEPWRIRRDMIEVDKNGSVQSVSLPSIEAVQGESVSVRLTTLSGSTPLTVLTPMQGEPCEMTIELPHRVRRLIGADCVNGATPVMRLLLLVAAQGLVWMEVPLDGRHLSQTHAEWATLTVVGVPTYAGSQLRVVVTFHVKAT